MVAAVAAGLAEELVAHVADGGDPGPVLDEVFAMRADGAEFATVVFDLVCRLVIEAAPAGWRDGAGVPVWPLVAPSPTLAELRAHSAGELYEREALAYVRGYEALWDAVGAGLPDPVVMAAVFSLLRPEVQRAFTVRAAVAFVYCTRNQNAQAPGTEEQG